MQASTGPGAWELFDAAPDGILVVAADGRVEFANRSAGALFAVEPSGLLGTAVEDLVPEDLRERHRAHRAGYVAAPAVRAMGVGLTLSARRRDGTTFPAEISLSPVVRGDETFTVAAVRDLTDRLAGEEALHLAEQRVVLAEERERIARDLHDTVIQRLFGTGLSLQAAAAMADEPVRGRVDSAIDELDATILDLRTTIFSLQADRGMPGGLRGRLVEVATDAGRSLGFEPRLRFEGPVDNLAGDLGEQLVPVLREVLSNVARHARATRVRVELSVGEHVRLVVVDDGVGVEGEVYGGAGLANLAERAERLGGELTVGPGDAGGTRVEWRVPLPG